MKIKVSKKNLQSMLLKVQGFTEKKSTLPVLGHVLLETGDNKLNIKATDLNVSIEVSAYSRVDEHGSCSVSARSFLDIVRELPDEDLDLSTHENQTISIESDKIKNDKDQINLKIMDSAEFPLVDFSDISDGHHIDIETFGSMIEQTSFSINTDDEEESKYNLEGALLITGSDENGAYIDMSTTDTRRMSLARRYIHEIPAMDEGIIVTKKGVQELKKLIDAPEQNPFLLLTRDSIFFVSDDTKATVRLIDGKFPDYNKVMDISAYPIHTTMDVSEFMRALRVCSAMVSGVSNCVRFSFKKDETILFADNPDQGKVE
ncbi:MAG: DNA polymerase III subunit beta, partial [Thermodesulfobacteriota bacterium]|nr:DNA polymerase III subunit beta [Thermodesulfobacteriota bacterium]